MTLSANFHQTREWYKAKYLTKTYWRNQLQALDPICVAILAVRESGSNLQHAPLSLQNNKEVVWEALQQDGRALQYASKELRDDEQTVDLAITQSWEAFQHASQKLQNKRELVEKVNNAYLNAHQFKDGRMVMIVTRPRLVKNKILFD